MKRSGENTSTSGESEPPQKKGSKLKRSDTIDVTEIGLKMVKSSSMIYVEKAWGDFIIT